MWDLKSQQPNLQTRTQVIGRGAFNTNAQMMFTMPQTPDIFSLADAAWKHPKFPCFHILALEFGVNIDIHKHENSEVLCSNRKKSPKEMSGNFRLQKAWKTC